MSNEAKRISEQLTNMLFELGSMEKPCNRIQFMSGDWQSGEEGQGGLNKAAFQAWACRSLEELLAAPSVEAVPDGWELIEKKTFYALHCGNSVVATLAGPEAEENAAKIKAMLKAAPTPPASAEPDQDLDKFVEFMIKKWSYNLAEPLAEFRESHPKPASAGGLDKDLAAIKERFSECHRRLCSPDNCVLDGVDCVLDFDKQGGAQ